MKNFKQKLFAHILKKMLMKFGKSMNNSGEIERFFNENYF